MVRFFVASCLAVSVALGAGAPPALAAVPAETQTLRPDPRALQPDPEVKRGVLPNGVHYEILRNPRPEGGISLRLGMNVGSFEESEAERGAAHFVEHMVFNGSKNFPEGEVDKIFQPLGVQFGQDQNAATGLYSTVYGLDLRTTADMPVATAFRWLRDVADGALFEPQAVNRERGVIMAEREQDLSSIEDTREAMRQFQGKGLRSTDRDPIGTVESLKGLNSDSLKAFYRRWYRPENATVVVVGDLPVEVMEKRIA